ncbi:unnamed protein product [Closterium sp. Naga37s-1]|nr:unnamed protein product [Closterium sp. Naga37s-1]
MHLEDMISEYLEEGDFEGDQDRDALDGLMLRTELHGEAASNTVRAAHPAQSQLNRRLSADYLERQMQSTEQNQLRMIQSLAAMDDSAERALYADVIAAMTDARACHASNGAAKSSCDDIQSQELRGSSLNAAVAGRLRAMGYDAAVCTTQWDTSPSIPEGSYEYIDVLISANSLAPAHASASPSSTLVSSTFHNTPSPPSPTFTRTTSSPTTANAASLFPRASSASANGAAVAPAFDAPPSDATPQRFIIDVDFRAQFQIARPTREYAAALESTPLVFVGRAERVARLVEVVSGAMRGALRAHGMHVPPWRKGEYLHAKWMAALSRRVVGKRMEEKGVEVLDDVTATPAASPFAARAAAPPAPTTSFHASAAPVFAASAAVAARASCQQRCHPADAALFQGRCVPARRFSALQQCARAGGRTEQVGLSSEPSPSSSNGMGQLQAPGAYNDVGDGHIEMLCGEDGHGSVPSDGERAVCPAALPQFCL